MKMSLRESGSLPTARLSFYLSVLVLAYIASFADRQIISLVVQPLKTELAIDDVQIGLVQGLAFSIVYSIAGLFCGAAADRFSRRLIIVVGITVWSLGSAACGLATTFFSLIACRLAVGLGEATLAPSAYSLLTDWAPRERLSAVIGIFTIGSNLGGGIALSLGGLLVQRLGANEFVHVPGLGELAPWRVAFLVTGLPGLGIAALALLLREPQRQLPATASERDKQQGFLSFCRTNARLLSCHLFGFALLGMVAASILAWGPSYLHRRFDWQPAHVGLALGLMIGFFGTVGTIGGGMAVDRLYRRGMQDAHLRVHIWTNILGGICAVAAFLTQSPWTCVALLWVAFPILISFGGSGPAALQLVAPRHVRARVSALYLLSVTGLGIGLGPVSVALLAKWVFHDAISLGLPLASLIFACVTISTMLFLSALKPLRLRLM